MDTIKFKAVQDKITKNINLEIYRPYGIDDEWMRVDTINEMTISELKTLTKYLVSLFKNK